MMIEGDELKQFQMVCAITELSFRVSTGARLSRANLVTFCREMYGTTSKQHKPLLREMLGVWEQTYGTRFDMERAYENAGLTTEKEQ